jgi:hypothetical protein
LPKTWVLGWGVAQLVEGLPSKCKALVFSIPSTEREREREGGKEGGRGRRDLCVSGHPWVSKRVTGVTVATVQER